VVPATSSYSKDDFFDQLSCDTLERLADGGEWGRLDGGGAVPCRAGWPAAGRCRAGAAGRESRGRGRRVEKGGLGGGRGLAATFALLPGCTPARPVCRPPAPAPAPNAPHPPRLPPRRWPAGDRDAWRSKMAAQRRVDVETFGGTARAGALRAALSSLFTPDSKPGAARGKRSGPSAGTRHAVPCR
jgi:hypothetical protein